MYNDTHNTVFTHLYSHDVFSTNHACDGEPRTPNPKEAGTF